jgi:predicted nucleic acid-binding protein
MIIVDSSVWIDYFNGKSTPQADLAIKSADNFRTLRKQGITVRKTIDVIIATFCIENDRELLFSDRDFLPFVDRLGLKSVL